MELQGKVIAVLPEKSGVSARGEWKAQSYVIETHEQYPKKLCFAAGATAPFPPTQPAAPAAGGSADDLPF